MATYSYNSNPIPDETRVTLRYMDEQDATASVGLYNRTYAVNDVYDPDISGSGTQPLSYDQWTAMYNFWLVRKCSYEVRVTSRTVSGRLTVAVVPTALAGTLPTDVDTAAQMRYAKVGQTTGGGPTVVIKGEIDMAKLFGVPDYAIESDENYSGSTSSSPNRRMALAVCCDTSGSSDALSFSVMLKYKTRFYRPQLAAVSLTSRIPAAAAAERFVGCTITRPGPTNERCSRPAPAEGPSAVEDGSTNRTLCTCGCMRHF